MPRILWFALGFLGGMAYTSQLINEQRVSGGSRRQQGQMKQKLASRIENQAERLGDMISERGKQFADKLSTQVDEQGHALAGRLREQGQQGQQGQQGLNKHHSKGQMASTDFGAGSASLNEPHIELASTAYPAGTASLPKDQQVIREPDRGR